MESINEIKRLWWDDKINNTLLYQPLCHPEFINCPAQQPCKERFQLMLSHLNVYPPKKVVDIGCHTGWFCRAFSKLGWTAIGIDKGRLEIDIATQLMHPWNGKPAPQYILGDIFEIDIPLSDVILCLSTAMYLFDSIERGWELFNKISIAAPIMFLDFGGSRKDKVPFTEETAIEEMLYRTSYISGLLLGYSELEQRPFYKFTR